MMKNKENLRCSFCYRSKEETDILISGGEAYICGKCIESAALICENEGISIKLKEKNNEIDITTLGVKPKFNKLQFIIKENHCFYLCPFTDPFNTIYKDHIIKSLESVGFTINRADEIFGTQPIIEDIWEEINCASIIIADVTGKNPNVMYEIGLAHTVGKPVIILSQTIDDVPFDLRHYRCIIYDYTPRGCQYLEDTIAKTLKLVKAL